MQHYFIGINPNVCFTQQKGGRYSVEGDWGEGELFPTVELNIIF